MLVKLYIETAVSYVLERQLKFNERNRRRAVFSDCLEVHRLGYIILSEKDVIDWSRVRGFEPQTVGNVVKQIRPVQ